MTKEELLVYNRLLKEIECASGTSSMVNFWFDKCNSVVPDAPEKPSKKYTEIELLPLPDKISVPIIKDLEYMQKMAKALEEIRHD
jgi:hypothetical protein